MAPSDTPGRFRWTQGRWSACIVNILYMGMIPEIFNIATDDQVEVVVPVFRIADLVTLLWIARQVFY